MNFAVKCALIAMLMFVATVSAKTLHPHGHVSGWSRGERANPEHVVPLAFAVKHKNVETLEALFHAVSDPVSPLYGKYATLDEVQALIHDQAAIDHVMEFLRNHHATNIEQHGSYVRATMRVTAVETLFQTQYHHYTNQRGANIRRSSAYTIPAAIAHQCDFIGYMNEFPAVRVKDNVRITSFNLDDDIQLIKADSAAADGYLRPSTINKVYGIDSNTVVDSTVTQGCFEDGQNVDPADLTIFQSNFSLPRQPLGRIIGPNDPSTCAKDINTCGEAALDIEYMMAVAQGANTTFWAMDPNDPTPFLDWLIAMGNDPLAPVVNSISYGQVEQQTPSDVTTRFNTEIQAIGARGITVMVSSGDDGVANFPVRTDSSKCGFFPSYPASSPYVTAVGATQGPENGTAEVGCASPTGGLITTGGGFSTVWPMPAYQKAAVKQYLNVAAGSTLPPTDQFNPSGRAYPDVSALGHNYLVVVGRQMFPVSGTSASSPVFAAMITLINSARVAAGKQVLGFLNPALYQAYANDPTIFNDITAGENNCGAQASADMSSIVCCQYGYTAVKGFDPVGGLGSPNFQKLKAALMAI